MSGVGFLSLAAARAGARRRRRLLDAQAAAPVRETAVAADDRVMRTRALLLAAAERAETEAAVLRWFIDEDELEIPWGYLPMPLHVMFSRHIRLADRLNADFDEIAEKLDAASATGAGRRG